jgi:hypothetical protein
MRVGEQELYGVPPMRTPYTVRIAASMVKKLADIAFTWR